VGKTRFGSNKRVHSLQFILIYIYNTIYCNTFLRFAGTKMGWEQAKVDALLLPLLKRLNSEQRSLTDFWKKVPAQKEAPARGIKSKRIRNVVARLKNGMIQSCSRLQLNSKHNS